MFEINFDYNYEMCILLSRKERGKRIGFKLSKMCDAKIVTLWNDTSAESILYA